MHIGPSADFEDMSCEMIYGQVPPPLEEDPVSKQPCYPNLCECSQIDHNKLYLSAAHLQNGLAILVHSDPSVSSGSMSTPSAPVCPKLQA
jgi:hypothetical protein